jgi:hypothetical protein
MQFFRSSIRRPVRRQGSARYILITLFSFAISVTLTRIFLELTGYPQLGNSKIHIAHVLWGGLLLFIASLLPLLYANRWVYTLGALLGGIGVGLFIDEVGKFITANNNYFYPLAAPIIYAFFLLTVLIYLRIKRQPPRDLRTELYTTLDALEEVIEHDLDLEERTILESRLRFIASQEDQPDLARLATELLNLLPSLKIVPGQPSIGERIAGLLNNLEIAWITQARLKAILIGGLLALAIVAFASVATTIPVGPTPTYLEQILIHLIKSGQLYNAGGLYWFIARLVLEASVGVLILISAGLLIAGKDRSGIALGSLSMLLSLTIVNLLIFYFNQFSTIILALIELSVWIGLRHYHKKYIPSQLSSY